MRSTGEVVQALTDLASVDVAGVPDQQNRNEMLGLVRAVNLAHAALMARITTFAHRDLAEADGHRSVKTWLTALARLTPHTAAGFLHRAALLRQRPALTTAAQAGDLSTEHLTRISALTEQVGLGVVQTVEDILATAAPTLNPTELGQLCDRVRAHADPDGAEPDPDEVLARRGLSLSRLGDMI